MEKYRYVHTPKSAGSLTAVQWTGKNLAEIERVFNGQAMFSTEHGRLKVLEGDMRLEVLQGNYLICLDENLEGRYFFDVDEKFFLGEHTPINKTQAAEPIKVLPPCVEADPYEKIKDLVEVTIGEKGFPTVRVKPGFRGNIVF